jgi:hypothetical protein
MERHGIDEREAFELLRSHSRRAGRKLIDVAEAVTTSHLLLATQPAPASGTRSLHGVHLLYKLGLSKRAIAAQMGWSEAAVDGLLRVYGHAEDVALSEVDALYSMHDSMHALPR